MAASASLAGELLSDTNNRAPVLSRNLCTFRDQLIALFVIARNGSLQRACNRSIGAQARRIYSGLAPCHGRCPQPPAQGASSCDMSDQQFTDKEIQIITAAFQDAVAATNRLRSGVWDLQAVNESITKAGLALGTLNAVLRLRDLEPDEWEAHLVPGAAAVTIRRKAQLAERPHTR